MAAFAASATCLLSADSKSAAPRTAEGECGFAYGADVLRGGFHRWTITLSHEAVGAGADGGATPRGTPT